MAALVLLFTSQCSPLYPINVWGDANCLLTVGRSDEARRGALSRDIYEQKGPLLYLIHAAAACLSDTGFSGVYLMEIPALTAALYAAYRLMRLRAGSALPSARRRSSGRWQRRAARLCAATARRDSACRCGGAGNRLRGIRPGAPNRCARSDCWSAARWPDASRRSSIRCSARWSGLCIVKALRRSGKAKIRRALKSAGVFLCGMAIPILPWMVYSAVNGALSIAYTAYLYNNIFL